MIVRSDLLLLSCVLLGPVCGVETRSGESNRPRGVGPEFAKFYKAPTAKPDSFACISNPHHVIPISQVNDDYCDCPDGSDEPGTSACAYLSHLSPVQPHPDPSMNTTLALPGFYCKNIGHTPAYLRFESVNDGRCDYAVCCDGSDEWQRVGGISCPDRCQEIGKEWRKKDELRQRGVSKAMKRKKELVAEADRLRKEVEMRVEELQVKIAGYEKMVAAADESLKATEQQERGRIVRGGGATSGGGKLATLLSLATQRVEELRTALVKTRTQRDHMLARVTELEAILSAFKDEHNPNFNDDGVKRAVRAWEEYAGRETDDGWEEAEDRDLDEISKEDTADHGINWSEFEASPEADVAALYQFTSYLPPSLRTWLDDKLHTLRQVLVQNGILADASDASSHEPKAVADARKVLTDAENELRNTRSDLDRHQDDLETSYGPDDIMRALKDKCISKDSGEYTYEMCFMGSTRQKAKKGGADTIMGHFVRFETELVDDDTDTADGRSLGKGERIVMIFDNGQHCWNGPNRSTRVVLGCFADDEIWKVSESEKCVYRMEVGTAAVCEAGARKESGKDEL